MTTLRPHRFESLTSLGNQCSACEFPRVDAVHDTALPDGIRTSRCSSCNAVIFWALTPAGKRCPYDAEPSLAGKYVIEAWNICPKVDGLDVRMALGPFEETDALYTSHFASCPNAAEINRAKTLTVSVSCRVIEQVIH